MRRIEKVPVSEIPVRSFLDPENPSIVHIHGLGPEPLTIPLSKAEAFANALEDFVNEEKRIAALGLGG